MNSWPSAFFVVYVYLSKLSVCRLYGVDGRRMTRAWRADGIIRCFSFRFSQLSSNMETYCFIYFILFEHAFTFSRALTSVG
jgi:hypothetical protein